MIKEFFDNGVMFSGVPKDTARMVYDNFSREVRKEGNYLFLTNIDYDDDWNEFYDLVILPVDDQYELIELIGTDGVNEDVTTEDIITQMKAWDEQVGFEIIYVDYSGIDAHIDHMPEDPDAFAEEVFDFCPWIIEEEFSSKHEYLEELEEDKYFYLWYGISFHENN